MNTLKSWIQQQERSLAILGYRLKGKVNSNNEICVTGIECSVDGLDKLRAGKCIQINLDCCIGEIDWMSLQRDIQNLRWKLQEMKRSFDTWNVVDVVVDTLEGVKLLDTDLQYMPIVLNNAICGYLERMSLEDAEWTAYSKVKTIPNPRESRYDKSVESKLKSIQEWVGHLWEIVADGEYSSADAAQRNIFENQINIHRIYTKSEQVLEELKKNPRLFVPIVLDKDGDDRKYWLNGSKDRIRKIYTVMEYIFWDRYFEEHVEDTFDSEKYNLLDSSEIRPTNFEKEVSEKAFERYVSAYQKVMQNTETKKLKHCSQEEYLCAMVLREGLKGCISDFFELYDARTAYCNHANNMLKAGLLARIDYYFDNFDEAVGAVYNIYLDRMGHHDISSVLDEFVDDYYMMVELDTILGGRLDWCSCTAPDGIVDKQVVLLERIVKDRDEGADKKVP